jgi:CheY-like chemotaxis protein
VASGPKDPRFDVSGALHDVSNSLTVLLGWIAEARAPNVPEAHREHAFAVIERQARLARSIARRAIGAEVLAAEGIAADALADVVDSMSALGASRGVTFARDGRDGAVKSVTIDRVADFSQVVMNLCLNALAFTPDKTTVTIAATADARGLVVDVTDCGEGVSEERAEDIFSGETTRPGGAGVGLRHARALARAAGGELTLVPPKPKEIGARFRLEWPRADRVPPKPPMSFSGLAIFNANKILLVEDDDAVIELVETALSAKGATVTVAKTLAACEAALSMTNFDCAVIDLSPLGPDPSPTFKRLSESTAPVVLITGAVDRAPDFDGDVRVVRKPFELRELLDALAKLLAESRR